MVEGNLIGTDVTGTVALPNSIGVWVDGGSTQNTIGGSTSGAGNLISGNTGGGVSITDIATASNVIAGNKIGTDVSGTLAVPNSGDGVLINDSGSNTIGGSTSGAGNLISGNSSFGVVIEGQNAYVNVVAGNLIGTDASGTVALGNDNGVGILGADYGNTIGGSAAGWGNLISGNTETGVVINGQDVVVQSVKNVVAGNLIGTNITGTFAVPNETGVLIDDSPNNTIGGSVSGDSNLISGNTGYGIYLDFGTTDTIIVGNKIGTDIAGTLALPNSTGIFVSADDNTIGGGAAGMGNLISGNTADGVAISGASGTVVAGNLIGTDVRGTFAIANSIGVEINSGTRATRSAVWRAVPGSGARQCDLRQCDRDQRLRRWRRRVRRQFDRLAGRGACRAAEHERWDWRGGAGDTIGGTAAGAGNVVSGNGDTGVSVSGGVVVVGNLIGTDSTGTVAVPNAVGISVVNGDNTIGGTIPTARNLISGNTGDGIQVGFFPGFSTNTLIEGNFIGLDSTGGVALANGGDGIDITAPPQPGGSATTIGGSIAGSGNVISANVGVGISIETNNSGNLIEGNFIGTDSTGTTSTDPNSDSLGNQQGGILDVAANDTIGGLTSGATTSSAETPCLAFP